MPRSKSKYRSKPLSENELSESDLKRFAGSSDEDDDDEQVLDGLHNQSSEDEHPTKDDNSERMSAPDEIASDDELEPDIFVQSSSAKMSNAMAKILGTSKKKRQATSVVLSQTTTPLQRMQMKQKEEKKALREKRRDNRERSLTALHIPLSVATTNTIKNGQNSVAKELEQERLHRRVATRGVVALFNAITQHQQVAESADAVSKANNEPKLTKHGFLSKIKTAASAETEEKGSRVDDSSAAKSSKWDAVNEDYLLNHKKNWDEELSDDEKDSFGNEDEPAEQESAIELKSRKKRRQS